MNFKLYTMLIGAVGATAFTLLVKHYQDKHIEAMEDNDSLVHELERVRARFDDTVNREVIKQTEIIRKEILTQVEMSNNEITRREELHARENDMYEITKYRLNATQTGIYRELIDKHLDNFSHMFKNKKYPQMKAVEFIKEIKSKVKDLEVDNRKLRLALSEYWKTIPKKYNTPVNHAPEPTTESGRTFQAEAEFQRYLERTNDILNIGLEFERYFGHTLEINGYSVKYHGLQTGKKDGGIDIIAKKGTEISYMQLKYWSMKTVIRENVVSQLYGAAYNMFIENGGKAEAFLELIKSGGVKVVLVTKTTLSKEAKEYSDRMGVTYLENVVIKKYPMIKLVHGTNKVYYLPTDDGYDYINFYSVPSKGYSRADNCIDAEKLGYRRAKPWSGTWEDRKKTFK